MSQLSLSLLGLFQATLGDHPIAGFQTDKVRGLLAYLAVEANRPHRRDKLVGLLWPDWPDPSALANLRNALALLRKAIGDRETDHPLLEADRETVRFHASDSCWVDVQAFLAFTGPQQSAARLADGIALYRGPFLEGFSLKDSAAFEEWLTATREQLERRCLAVLARLAEQHEAARDPAKACEVAWRAVDLAPWQEESHRRLMRLLALSGQRSAALTQYETCHSVLKRELGVEPAAETTRLYEQIRDGAVARGEAGGQGGKGAEARASSAPPLPRTLSPLPNLPTFLTPFVGRTGLVAEVQQQLQAPGCRLLTLIGPGGSGKTRLAVEAADGLTASFPQGVYFVALAAVSSPDGIVPAIGQALGFSFREREDPRQQLLSYLRAKTLLLILDNYEHLLRDQGTGGRSQGAEDGEELLVKLLRDTPGVKLLVTSRAALNVEAEQLLPVGGMAVPEETRSSLAEASASSAVQLFMQTAQRGQPAFRLTDDNLASVLAICRRVAGLPLGIVLAAAWLRLLTPAEVVAELEGQGLDLLESDRHDLPERQRSLRTAFDYSWRLLSAREREVLAGLSVFRGGATYTAAHEVTGATLRDLRGLANSSLLERTPGGRYILHELLRQYAEEKLDVTADGGQAERDRHARYFAAALSRWATEIKSPQQTDTLAEMDLEIGNVQAAWDWVIARDQFELLKDGIFGLCQFYTRRQRCRDGERAFRALSDALEARRSMQPISILGPWAVALAQQALYGMNTGNLGQAAELARRSRALLDEAAQAGADVRRERAFIFFWLEEPVRATDTEGAYELANVSLALFRALGDDWGSAHALAALGDLAHYVGDYEDAIRYQRESVGILHALGVRRDAAAVQAALGRSLFYAGHLQEAESLQAEAVAFWRSLGGAGQLHYALYLLAKTLRGLEKYVESSEALQESLTIAEEDGHTICLALALKDLGAVHMRTGCFDQARAYLGRSFALFRELKRPGLQAMVAQFLGEIALYENKPAEAYQLLAEAVTIFRKIQTRSFINWTSAVQGVAALKLGRRDEARDKLCEALRAGLARHDLATVLAALAGATLLLVAEGDQARAVELYTLVARYPILGEAPQLKIYTGERMTAIIAALPAVVVAAAQAAGQAADPFAAAEALLAEWGG